MLARLWHDIGYSEEACWQRRRAIAAHWSDLLVTDIGERVRVQLNLRIELEQSVKRNCTVIAKLADELQWQDRVDAVSLHLAFCVNFFLRYYHYFFSFDRSTMRWC